MWKWLKPKLTDEDKRRQELAKIRYLNETICLFDVSAGEINQCSTPYDVYHWLTENMPGLEIENSYYRRDKLVLFSGKEEITNNPLERQCGGGKMYMYDLDTAVMKRWGPSHNIALWREFVAGGLHTFSDLN